MCAHAHVCACVHNRGHKYVCKGPSILAEGASGSRVEPWFLSKPVSSLTSPRSRGKQLLLTIPPSRQPGEAAVSSVFREKGAEPQGAY